MTSISDLSQDLVEEILSRVPMTSLGATRSTCKLWNTLSKDPSFKHCGKAAKEIMVIMIYDYKACLMSVNLHNHTDLVNPFIKPIGQLKQVEICEVFHCDGLLLCVTYERYKYNSRLVVWNPYCGQTRWIQPISHYWIYCTSRRDVYGMGYDSNNNHKILRVSYWLRCRGYEIYDFKSNTWRVLDSTIDWHIYGQGVSLKGNNYFISQERWVVGEETLKKCLLCFDFTRDKFWGLPLPCHSRMDDCVILCVVSEEKLAVLSRRFDSLEMEIWITNKIEPNAVSWSYFLKVDKVPSYRFQYLHGSFFVDEKKKVAVICEIEYFTTGANYKACMVGEGGHYTEVDLGESLCQPRMCSSYVPSSMQIQ